MLRTLIRLIGRKGFRKFQDVIYIIDSHNHCVAKRPKPNSSSLGIYSIALSMYLYTQTSGFLAFLLQFIENFAWVTYLLAKTYLSAICHIYFMIFYFVDRGVELILTIFLFWAGPAACVEQWKHFWNFTIFENRNRLEGTPPYTTVHNY